MRAYVETLRMEDCLYGHPFYSKAAQGAIAAYLALHDTPSSAESVRACVCLFEGVFVLELK